MSSCSGALYLALVYLNPGQREALRRYENQALPVFRRHGGRVERILSPVPGPAGDPPERDPEIPDEVHLLRFDTPDGLDAVRRDPEMVALLPLRNEVVRRAVLVAVEDVPLDRYFG